MLLHAAFVADELCGFMLEPARIVNHEHYSCMTFHRVIYGLPFLVLYSRHFVYSTTAVFLVPVQGMVSYVFKRFTRSSPSMATLIIMIWRLV